MQSCAGVGCGRGWPSSSHSSITKLGAVDSSLAVLPGQRLMMAAAGRGAPSSLGMAGLHASDPKGVQKAAERGEVLDGLLRCCRWVEVFYAWRPNLPDEAGNHLIELAVAAQADVIVSRNLRDLSRGELQFPGLQILTPESCLEVFPCPP